MLLLAILSFHMALPLPTLPQQVLRHVCQGMSRALACLPQQQLPSDLRALQPATWIDALLRETAAASAAASHWEPVLASSGPVGDVTAGWIKGVDWACLDAALALTALLGTPPSAPAANGGAARPAQACRGTERLPAGVLWEDVLVSLLPEAISALQWASAGAMLHLLRCLRRVWALLLDDRGLQVRGGQTVRGAFIKDGTVTHPGLESRMCRKWLSSGRHASH